MPTFAELKAKAAGAANTGREKLSNVKDRNTSVPMAKTNWDPYSGESAPPPPPPRSLVNASTKPKTLAPKLPPPPSRTSTTALSASSSRSRTGSISPPPPPARGSTSGAPPPPPPRSKAAVPPAPPSRSSVSAQRGLTPTPPSLAADGPPPIVRSTRPNLRTRQETPEASPEPDRIDWANLTPEDKEVFFSWLDEFFANFTPPTAAATKPEDTRSFGAVSHAPPPLRATTKPSTWSHQAGTPSKSNAFILSHPPATAHGHAALDLAQYFRADTPWNTAWYMRSNGPSIPPPLEGDRNHAYSSSRMSMGSAGTTYIGVFFCDLSIFWGSVEYNAADSPSTVHRRASFIAPPKALSREALVDAHATYGETIALFAESFVGSGQYCARGECWDLANEALKYFADFDYVPKPVPSISRTHGHLIYGATARDGGLTIAGRWRGGDDCVRRGDIVEWRKARIGAAQRGSFFTLGDPDHTAIIVSDCKPGTSPADGESLNPADLGVLVVVEQGLGQLPERKEYDLSRFEEGEMWIYRAISMEAYLGVLDITAVPPEGLDGLLQL